MATFPRKICYKGRRERKKKKKQFQKKDTELKDFSHCNAFATKEFFAYFLDAEEVYACLEASEKDTVIFPLYYQVSHEYEDRILKYKRHTDT